MKLYIHTLFLFAMTLGLFVQAQTTISFNSDAVFEGTFDANSNPAIGDRYRYSNVATVGGNSVDALFEIVGVNAPLNSNQTAVSPNGFNFDPAGQEEGLRSATWGDRTGAEALVIAGAGGITYDGNTFAEDEVVYASNSKFATEANMNGANITNFTTREMTGIENNSFIDLEMKRPNIGSATPDASNTANVEFNVKFVNAGGNDAVTIDNFQMTFFDIDGAPFADVAEYIEVTGASQYIVDQNTDLAHKVENGKVVAYVNENGEETFSNSLEDAYDLTATPEEVIRQGNNLNDNELDFLDNGDGVDGYSALAAFFENTSEFNVLWGMYANGDTNEDLVMRRGLWLDGGDHIDLVFENPITVIPEIHSLGLMALAGLSAALVFRRKRSKA